MHTTHSNTQYRNESSTVKWAQWYQDAKPVEIRWGAPNLPLRSSPYCKTMWGDIAA